MTQREAWRLSLAPNVTHHLAKAANAVLGSRGCLFTFHRGAPTALWDNLPNRGFYLDLGFLDRLLSYLAQTGWAVVTMDEVLKRSARGRGSDRYVNFSIDDCTRDTFEEVVPLFRRHRVPVTLFVTTGIPDGTLSLWQAGLEDVLRTHDSLALETGIINVATPEAKRAAYAHIAAEWDGPHADARYFAFCRLNGVDIAATRAKHAMTWDMLAALRDDPFVEIGAHSINHLRIASLTEAEAANEISGSRDRLQSQLGVACRHFAFPYGRSGDCGPRDFALGQALGFASLATTRKGLVRSDRQAFNLRRNTLNGAHRHFGMIEAHLTGFTGFAAKVLGRV